MTYENVFFFLLNEFAKNLRKREKRRTFVLTRNQTYTQIKYNKMSTKEMNVVLNKRINDLIEAGAKKELMQKGLSENEANQEIMSAAIRTLVGF